MFLRKRLWKTGIGILVAACLLGGTFIYLSNPLRRSDGWLHAWLLKKVPVGSSQKLLLEVIKREGWKFDRSWVAQDHRLDRIKAGGIEIKPPLFGDSFFIVNLGHFYLFLREDVVSYWAFDDKGNLIDVRINREYDGP